MRIQTFEELAAAEPVRQGFRSGAPQFHDLMTGVEGTPANYGLQLVQVQGPFGTPRHRHNFEQVRVMLQGEFGFGPGQVQRQGSVGYFCEGTYYTQDARTPSTTLLLQIGGPSGDGFMSRRQLRSGIEELAQRGTFEDGVYTWHDATGKKHNQDSYEAVWEHVHGRPVKYPAPQYLAPVLLEPDRFDWLPQADGVAVRRLGAFNGRGLALSQWRLQAGAQWRLPTSAQPLLLFCLEGEGAAGEHAYRRWTSLEVQTDEDCAVRARVDSAFFVFHLPDLVRAEPA